MPVCNNCGSHNMQPGELMLLRQEGGRWTTRCRNCPDYAARDWPLPGTLEWLGEPPLHLATELLRTVNELRVGAGLEPVGQEANRRQYARHEVDLHAVYKTRKDPTPRQAQVKDLSKGGLCLVVKEPIHPAEIFHVEISSPEDHLQINFSSDVEVVRCIAVRPGHCEIGGRFLGRDPAQKRRDPRHAILLTVWYQRKGSSQPAEGAVIDISRGGLGFVAQEEIPVGEVLAVSVRGESGAFHDNDLRGLVRVVRSLRVMDGNYELGTEFIKTRVIPRAEEPEAPGAANAKTEAEKGKDAGGSARAE